MILLTKMVPPASGVKLIGSSLIAKSGKPASNPAARRTTTLRSHCHPHPFFAAQEKAERVSGTVLRL